MSVKQNEILLAIDQGNTCTKFGLFKNKKLTKQLCLNNNDAGFKKKTQRF